MINLDNQPLVPHNCPSGVLMIISALTTSTSSPSRAEWNDDSKRTSRAGSYQREEGDLPSEYIKPWGVHADNSG